MGVLVERLHQNGPAEKAGVKVGDVVVAVGRHDVDAVQALRFRIATRPIGESIDLRVVRRGKAQTIRFGLVAPPEDPPRNLTLLRGRNPFAGATVGNLSPALGAELGAEDLTEGVMLLGIERGSTADRLGLRPQDIVREVNGRKIDRVADLERIAAQPQERWQVVLTRGDRTLQFEVAG